MHYQVIMTVRLTEPLKIDPPDSAGTCSEATGYIITMGVNAPDIVDAIRKAHVVALRPKQEDGSFVEHKGTVEDAEAKRIERDDWDSFIVENATRIDQPGVYYSSGLIFFNHSDTDRKWWQFWK